MQIYCPNCETPCGETAMVCRRCGHMLVGDVVHSRQDLTSFKNRNRKTWLPWSLAICVLTLIAAVVLVRITTKPVAPLGKPTTSQIHQLTQPVHPSTKTQTLSESMKSAASRLNLEVPELLKFKQAAEAYKEVLSRGQPIIASCSRLRIVTIQFAKLLPENQRNEWLRECKDQMAKREGFSTNRAELRSAGWSNVWYCGTDDYESVLEGVYNLATDQVLKAEALDRWNRIAMGRYNSRTRQYDEYSKREARGERVIPGEMPEVPMIPLWRTD